MKFLSLEFWAEPGEDKVLVHSDVLRGLTPSQTLLCLGQSIDQILSIARAIAKEANLPPGAMNKMMRGG